MKYKIFGKTNLKVSELGLGCAQIAGPSNIGGKLIGSPLISKTEAVKILEIAFDNGINLYDTSNNYGDGKSEEYIGEVFQKKRDKVIISTKCGDTKLGTKCFEKKIIIKSAQDSLRRLKTDYIDILQLKGPDLEIIKQGEIYNIFDELKKKGYIKYSGVSTAKNEHAIKLAQDNKIDTLQIFYNLLYLEPEQKLLDLTKKNNIGIICRSPLSSGLLTGKITKNTKFKPEDDRNSFMYGDLLEQRLNIIDKIKLKFDLNNNDLRLLSLNYLLSNEKVNCVIPGASSVNQILSNLEIINKNRLSNEKIKKYSLFLKKL